MTGMVDDDDEDERVSLQLKRIESMRDQALKLDRQFNAIPKLFPLVVIAIPIGLKWGVFAGFMALVCVFSLFGVCFYMFGARRIWYRQEADQLERELKKRKR